MKANMKLLFRAVEAGAPLPFAAIRNRRSFAYVENAAAAFRAILFTPSAADETFYVSDGLDLSTPDLVRRIANALGRQARLFPMPGRLLRGAGTIGGLLSRIAGRHLSTESITAVLGSLFVDITTLRETTGYEPPVSIENGMSLTAEWFRARNGAAAS
jgi:nucleoside-diphosphate-sugar epimerase